MGEAPKKIQRPAIPIAALTQAPPRRRGCAFWLLSLVAVVLALLSAGWMVSSLALSSAQRSCAAVPVGMARSDVETLLEDDAGARLLGSGGPSGAPISSLELGVRGALVSWSCQVGVDAEGRATGTHFHSWLVPDAHGSWDDRLRVWIEGLLPG
jgi:hypothetical protein